jgi:7-cyano-7-deazaguanine reductase
MVHFKTSNPLGQKTAYIADYNPGLLFAIARQESRDLLNINADLPFFGCDIWTAYELSWLNAMGKPEVAVAEFCLPCESPFIVESKSFKLYLNSFNQSKFSSFNEVAHCLTKDLSFVAGATVQVNMLSLQESSLLVNKELDGTLIDKLYISADVYRPQPNFLSSDSTVPVNEKLYSHLLKSNCPVTGQPDWASIFLEYRGPKIHQENLLRYIISFREHQDFHENCVERIFMDVFTRCKPEFLSVYARYNRRGGLDINPFRSSEKNAKPEVGRLLRQ